MKFIRFCGFFPAMALLLLFTSCKKHDQPLVKETPTDIDTIAAHYYDQYLKLYPLEATRQGDNRYNDQLPVNIREEFISGEISFYRNVLQQMKKVNYKTLDDQKKTTYDVLDFTLKDKIERYAYHPEYIPFSQFEGLPLDFPVLGSGQGAQPFKTYQDYKNWLSRMEKFPEWMEAAQANFRKGMATGFVLPKVLVEKMIPQMNAAEIVTNEMGENIFYGPVQHFPKNITKAQQGELQKDYAEMISTKIIPAYKQMAAFLQNEYLPKARESHGLSGVPNGANIYHYYVKSWTTTTLTVPEIQEMGEREVALLRYEMDKVKKQLGFEGSLEQFLNELKKDPRAMPYKSPQEIISGFNGIYQKIQPGLKKMFTVVPKTKFEIRQTEKFREATASAEYIQGAADGSRPGIFYIPIPDATKFNITSGMESLFLHEAIPGHHYQISLQQENMNLPKFMRFGWFGAYGEGWAHYTETLGFELGLYTDPYQKMGYLSDQMLRAVRLVIDTGLHTGTMNREQAIRYFLNNVAYDEQGATAEVERYMAIPGQALSYKVGALKIRELRQKYTRSLGTKFNLASFHDEVLSSGCLPISVLERKVELWAARQKQKAP